ncbi:MAG: EF2563 family selenium-dependent molybdenum hydroxylase system protein [Proteobacteria bacterium]|nr:EF2563 family selenium-dependent molybdenum hydroxylase system protein [Pseudomonadota bacterium]
MKDVKIVIKGAGEMATGIACRLYMSNLKKIVMTEIPKPITVRRAVAFSGAVYDSKKEVEGIKAEYIVKFDEVYKVWGRKNIAVIVDPSWKIINEIKPDVIVDAIMTKRNTNTIIDEAPLVIGVGPGFTASENAHIIIESNRGHNLGRLIYKGSAEPHTGIPGPTMGFTKERVLRAPHSGMIKHSKNMGDEVKKGDLILFVNETPVYASIDGILRGLIREIEVVGKEKVGDIDPRGDKDYCHTITEKARAIGGSVLEAIMQHYNVSL